MYYVYYLIRERLFNDDIICILNNIYVMSIIYNPIHSII